MNTIADPDCRLFTLMSAYAVLEVPCSASSRAIRRAYRQLMSQDHPDLHHAGSESQRNAMTWMGAINDAYRLVRDGPLRSVNIGNSGNAERTWKDAELDETIRRGRADRLMRDIGSAVALVGVGVVLSLLAGLRLDRTLFLGLQGYAVALPLACALCGALLGRRFLTTAGGIETYRFSRRVPDLWARSDKMADGESTKTRAQSQNGDGTQAWCRRIG